MADTDELEEEVEIPPRLSMEAQNQTEPEEESLPRYYPIHNFYRVLFNIWYSKWLSNTTLIFVLFKVIQKIFTPIIHCHE